MTAYARMQSYASLAVLSIMLTAGAFMLVLSEAAKDDDNNVGLMEFKPDVAEWVKWVLIVGFVATVFFTLLAWRNEVAAGRSPTP